MPRIRSLKPETPSDPTLATCSREARLTFLYVIAQADDYGLLLAAPRQLLGHLYPHDQDVTLAMLMGWIEELVEKGRLRWRECRDGARVLEVINWTKHQKVDKPGKADLRDNLIPLRATKLRQSPEKISGDSTETTPKISGTSGENSRAERDRDRDREQGEGPNTAGDKGRRLAEPEGWVSEAQATWKAIGIIPWVRLRKALRPAVQEFGSWEAIRPWFEAYCRAAPYRKRDGSIHGDRPGDKPDDAVRDTRFVSPESFVKEITFWRERCQPMFPENPAA